MATADDKPLLCDEMLAGLARWLRAAGYKTALAERGCADRVLVERCRLERRILVTRDRHLIAQLAPGVRSLLLDSVGIDAHAHQLAGALRIDWCRAPFTRCLIDNTPLDDADPGTVSNLPLSARERTAPFRQCSACGRAYWPGSHVRRMHARMRAWRDAAVGGLG